MVERKSGANNVVVPFELTSVSFLFLQRLEGQLSHNHLLCIL
jgi:hypothetical protein